MSLKLAPLKELSSGHKIPVIGFGVYQTPAKTATTIVYQALKIGYRHVDSAVVYNNEEESVQGILKWLNEDPEHNKREDIFYTTKVPNTAHGYDKTVAQIKSSLEKAEGLGYIDLILIHSPLSDKEKRLGTYKALQEAVEAGTVRSIGVSNYGIHHIKELFRWKGLKIKPVINQIELSPWLQRTELVDFCKANGLALEAYSPLTRGTKLDAPDLVKLAEKYNKSPAQILVKWSIQKGFIPLPKTVSPVRAKENFDVFDFDLTRLEITELGDHLAYHLTCWDPVKEPLEYDWSDKSSETSL